MRINEYTAVSTSKVLLVPYDGRHVHRYHQWMQDPAIQEATASEPLTLDEEYENQQSWRASHDKLTFILCQPTDNPTASNFIAGKVDTPDRMIGDINFFLYPWRDDDEETAEVDRWEVPGFCAGEVDIMIAERGERGKGLGRAAVLAFLHYIYRNLGQILAEYDAHNDENINNDQPPHLQLRQFMVKIKESNLASISLFKGLGFVQQGPANYFGEIELTLEDFIALVSKSPEHYIESAYSRS